MEEIDKTIEERGESHTLLIECLELTTKIRNKEKQECEDIMQKNKNNWRLEGDENSTLFHRNIKKKKHLRNLKGIEIDGMWETDPVKVKNHFRNYYEDIFKEDTDSNWRQDIEGSTRILITDRNNLEKLFDETELKEAIWSCGSNKSPGPDGFTVEFYKKYWDLMKSDLLEALNEFALYPKLPKGVNTAFITLIPKTQNPTTTKDFRPISLVSSMYKILSKMVANRLKNVLPKIIDKTQSAFIKERQFLMVP